MKGTLLIAGGNVGATERGKKEIYGRFAALCGGVRGRAMLVVTAGEDPEDSWRYNRELLLGAGVGGVVLLPLTEKKTLPEKNSWTDRADDALLPFFDGVTGIWFTGGDQLRTTRLLQNADGSDTAVLARMRRLLEQGGAVGGTSAGAAVMSRVMIARGDDAGALTMPPCTDPREYREAPEAGGEQLLLARGLGFLPGGVVDQHFDRRPRLQRLIAAMEYAGEERGFGISEDTALEVSLESGAMRVCGSAYVLCVTRRSGTVTLKKYTAADHAVL